MRMRFAGLVTAAVLLATAPAYGQVAWDSPLLVPPNVQAYPGLGIYLIDASGAGIGALLTWRSPQAAPAMGLRIGLAEGRRRAPGESRGVAVLGGVDLSGSLTRASPQFPLDVDWVFGAGVGVDDWARVSFPLGLTLGRRLTGDGVVFIPYFTPRIHLDARLGGRAPDDSLDLGFALDLGLELGFAPGWMIRFGGTLADRSAIAIGVLIQ